MIYKDDITEDTPLEIRQLMLKDVYYKEQEYKERARGLQRLKQKNRKQLNVTPALYAKLNAAQQGKCAICQKQETAWPRKNLAVDHDHNTGKIRALLCTACNMAIGLMRDDPDRLRSAANYLEKHKP